MRITENDIRRMIRTLLEENPPETPTKKSETVVRIPMPGKLAPLGKIKPEFVSREGMTMIPARSVIVYEKGLLKSFLEEKDRAKKDEISRKFLYGHRADASGKSEFDRYVELNKFLVEMGCTQDDIEFVFEMFNNQPLDAFHRYDAVLNDAGMSRQVPPSLLKAVMLKESTLGTKKRNKDKGGSNRSDRFSIGLPIFTDLKSRIPDYVPSFEDVMTSPSVEAKVAATLLSRGIPMIHSDAGNIVQVLGYYRRGTGDTEPEYEKKVLGAQRVFEVMQVP